MKKNFKDLKVVVTGGDGFIGSHLLHKLTDLGAKVFCIAEPQGQSWRIEDIERKISILRFDICDRGLKNEIRRIDPDKAFHLASFVNPSRDISLTDEMFRINLNGTINFISAFKGLKCEIIVNTGTCEEYGDTKAPFRESDLPRPVSPYSSSKVAGSFYCQMLNSCFSMPVVTLRPFLTYGPKQSGNLFIPALIKAALRGQDFEMTKGEQTREFNYVSDIVEGYLKAGSTARGLGRIINIGCGRDYKIKDAAKKIIELVGNPVNLRIGSLPYRPGEVKRFYCENSLAKKLFKWKPEVGLIEGLRRTIEWYRNQISLN